MFHLYVILLFRRIAHVIAYFLMAMPVSILRVPAVACCLQAVTGGLGARPALLTLHPTHLGASHTCLTACISGRLDLGADVFFQRTDPAFCV